MEFARGALGGQRGLGIDIDPKKVALSVGMGNEAIVADACRMKTIGKVRFAVMSHFIEHLDSVAQARQCIATAVRCARDFVLVQQPCFDADGYLFERGLKFCWSDWRGHRIHLSTTQFYGILAALVERRQIARFVIGRRIRVKDSNDPQIHSLRSPPDQLAWSETHHPPKPYATFDFPVFKEMFGLIFPRHGVELGPHLEAYMRKKDGQVIFDSQIDA